MADKLLQIHPTLNVPYEVEATVISTGAGNAGDVVALDAGGKLDVSVLPTGIGPDVVVIEASENLGAGDFVNIYESAGSVYVRRADASAPNAGEIAHGFVLNNVNSGDNATVYFEGPNGQLSGLTPGTTYALSSTTPGGVVPLSSATTTAGESLQILGVATSTTSINVEIGRPTIRG